MDLPLTSQQGNENNNMAEDDPIFQGEFVKLSESRRLFIGSKTDSWKPKHIILRRKGEKPVLEYHKKKQKNYKKGEKSLTHSFELWPTFKVEKLTNARGRSFVCEITAPDIHQFVSSDQETDIDIFVFLLQSQIRLKENLREDIISVVPDESEAQIKIGAKGSKCFLHISPWGITLALAKSRALLAQWPLKSIRYYETSGDGHFTIEAGRVAPMGEGVFGFRTASGEDDKTYDLVDNYIVNTLDRVKPNQRGTQEEIEDYIREHDFLHSLTMVHARDRDDLEIKNVLKQCWNIGRGTEQGTDSTDLQPTPLPTPSGPPPPSTPPTPTITQTSRINVTLERTISNGQGSSNTFPSDAKSSTRPPLVSESRMSPSSPGGRPPLPGRVAKRSRRRDHSLPRKIDVVTQPHPHQSSSSHHDDDGARGTQSHTPASSSTPSVTSPQTPPQQPRTSGRSKTPELPSKRGHHASTSSSNSIQPPRRHSNPSNVVHAVNATNSLSPLSIQPYQNQPPDHHSHTEFYNLNSPNLKVRVSKSPIVTRHPNKVGRAEYLLSVQESGVRSPTSPETSVKNAGKWELSSSPSNFSSDDENLETKKYMEAVARASKKKYGGGHSSLDRTWGKSRHDGTSYDQMSLGVDSFLPPELRSSSSGYVNTRKVSGGYVNLNSNSNNSTLERKLQDRQNSVESFVSALSRQNSVKNSPSSPPPPVHHHRQRSAPVEVGSVDESGYQISPLLRKKVGEKGGNSSHEDSGVSLRSRSSQLSSDDGLSRDSAHSIGSFKSAVSRQPSGFSTLDSGMEEPSAVTNWLMSASCEDLSDHMRHVIFQDDDGNKAGEKLGEEFESTYEEIRNTEAGDGSEGNGNSLIGGDASASCKTDPVSDDKPPLPFTGLKKFQNNASSGVRDRSKSFGYMNMPQPVAKDNPSLPVKQPSSAPSAHLIRKMVSARAKQDTLRKSLSNPNFLNLGSKEQLFKLKISSRNNINSSSGNLSSNSGEKLNTGTKQKSRSFGNLFPAIKKALSRESIGNSNNQSRSTTPERRSSFRRSSFSFRRKSTDDTGLRRQNSLHVPGEMTIKGIRMTTRSRSFRRVRQTKSVDSLSTMADSGNHEEPDPMTTYATISHPRSSRPAKDPSTPTNPPQAPPRTSIASLSNTNPRPDDSKRQSGASVQLRTSSSSSSLKTLPKPKLPEPPPSSESPSRNGKAKSDLTTVSSSPQLQMKTSASSSSLKVREEKSSLAAIKDPSRNSNTDAQFSSSSPQQSNPPGTTKSPSNVATPSFSANFTITLSNPHHQPTSPTTVSTASQNHFAVKSTPNPSPIVSSSTQPTLPFPVTELPDDDPSLLPLAPPPPLPPRQKSSTSIAAPTKSTKSKVSKQNSSSTSFSNSIVHTTPGLPDNMKYNGNGQSKSVTSSAYISPNYINANRCSSSSNINDNSNSKIKTATETFYCQTDGNGNSSLPHQPPSTNEIPTSAARQLSNGSSSPGALSGSPSRRRSRLDKISPKS